MMCNAVFDWNDDMIEYILNNYDEYDFLDTKIGNNPKTKNTY